MSHWWDKKFLFAVMDKETGLQELVIEKTINSYNVTRTKLSNKGINCTNWFDEKRFFDKFTLFNHEQH